MAVNYSMAVKNARLRQVVQAIDGAGGTGTIRIGTAGMARVLAEISLAQPSFGPPMGGMIELADTPLVDGAAAASGTPAEATIIDGRGVVVVSGLTVGGAGADIVLGVTEIVLNQEVRITGGSIVHA